MSVSYSSPTAFRRALTDRLRAVAKPRGGWPLADVQRQFVHDRLLARLHQLDEALSIVRALGDPLLNDRATGCGAHNTPPGDREQAADHALAGAPFVQATVMMGSAAGAWSHAHTGFGRHRAWPSSGMV
jgi:hypothetical protein